MVEFRTTLPPLPFRDAESERVVRDGDGCEAVFTLRRLPGVSDEEFERDAKAVAGDLARLKKIVEGRKPA